MTALELRNVHKSYPHPSGDVSVLRGAQAKIAPGEVVACLGPSGSGKSTLLSLLAGLDRPTAGEIVVGDHHLESMNEEELTHFRARSLGIIFQQFHLMNHLTALENVSLPLRIANDKDAYQKAEAALGKVELGHRTRHFPHEMSGGECQRVAIARAMVIEPPVLLADEPSGNLDTQTGEIVMSTLFGVARGQNAAMILVTHNEKLAQRCDRSLHLHDGVLTESK